MTMHLTDRHGKASIVSEVWELFRNNVRAHGLYILAIMIVIVARLALIDDADVLLLNTILPSIRAIVTTVGLWLAVFFFYKSIKLKSVFASIDLLRAGPLSRRNAQYAIPAGLAAAFLMNSFANFKASIPMFNTYDIDPLLAEIDRFVHFGYDPWRITETVFGYGRFTWMIDNLYYLWFPAIFIPLAAAIVSPPTVFRHRFLLSFTLVWVFLGVVLATLTASGGPIFYDSMVGGPSSFSPLVDVLATVNADYELNTIFVRDLLWDIYSRKASTTVSGISAMPSIHNAMCILLVLAARHIDRRLTILAMAFAAAIFVGSVHLGWHYAIDAYVSMIAVPAIWKFAGWATAHRGTALAVGPAALSRV